MERDQLEDLGKNRITLNFILKMGHADFNDPGQGLIAGFWDNGVDDDEPSGFTAVDNFSVF
jgi:hypothetical protein